MDKQTQVEPLLQAIVKDNESYFFPFYAIRLELLEMLSNQEELQYFTIQAHKKLKNKFPPIFSTVFLNTMEMILDTNNVDPYTLPYEEYYLKIEELTEVLENLVITRIPKDSPDGEMMVEML
jgi:hypothetical protein